LPPVKGTVRVERYSSHFVIRPLLLPNGTQSTRACQFAVLAIDDPKMVNLHHHCCISSQLLLMPLNDNN
jgi:hypothetical protein